MRKLLIPSIAFNDAKGLKRLSGRFPMVEVNLHGLKRELPPDEIEQLKAASRTLRQAGARTYAVHLKGFDLSRPGDSTLHEAAIRYCRIVHDILKPEIAVLHPGRGDLSNLLSNLDVVARQIPGEMTIAIENMTRRHVLRSPESIEAFVEGCDRLPQNVGVCIDTTHPKFMSGPVNTESYTGLVLEYIRSALPRLRHLHFSDRSARGGKHLPIGDGMIDWRRVDDFLRENGYEGHATIEIRSPEGATDKIIRSADAYYGRRETDLNDGSESTSMADETEQADFLAKLEALPSAAPLPAPVSELLDLPGKALVEQSEEHTYFIVPSAGYKKEHADPFDVLSGESVDRLDWADYIFGVRYHGSYLSAVLIDKERRIAVCDTLLYLPSGEKMDWTRFGDAVKKALDYAKTESPNPEIKTDHVMVTPYGGVQFIEVMEELAWGQD